MPVSSLTRYPALPARLSQLLSLLLCWLFQPNCRVRFRSFWREPLGDYDAVCCCLSPAPLAALWQEARVEMSPDALLLGNSFEVPGVEAQENPGHRWPAGFTPIDLAARG